MFPTSLAEDYQQIKVPKHDTLGNDIFATSKPFCGLVTYLWENPLKIVKVKP
jgi:hypothetical protein